MEATPVAAHINPAFIGFGYETSAVAEPNYFSAGNETLIQLYRNLSLHGLIRIGGIISDHTKYEPDGASLVRTQTGVTVINKKNLADLGDFARATGWKVMWGLNLGTGSKAEAVEEAVAVNTALGTNLQSFEIGNEVEELRHTYEAYHSDYLDFKNAIRAALPNAPFSGPDSIGRWPYVTNFARDESGDIRLLTTHYYRGGAGSTNATLDRLLQRDAPWDKRLEDLQRLCTERHLDYRINEVNSFSGGGKRGVSDTFGSALWGLDYMFNLASHGCAGVNMETDINQLGFISHYSPIVHDTNGVCHARAEYYGMLAFAMAGNGDLLKVALEAQGINLTAYATRDARDNLFVTVINKDFSRDVAVEFHLPQGYPSANAFRLAASSVTNKNGVTFAGNEVSADGKWSAGAPEEVSVTDGAAQFRLPHASAIVVRCAPVKE